MARPECSAQICFSLRAANIPHAGAAVKMKDFATWTSAGPTWMLILPATQIGNNL